MLSDKIITVANIGLTPDMLVTLCTNINHSALPILTQDTITYFATQHEKPFKKTLMCEINVLVNWQPGQLLKNELSTFFETKFNLSKRITADLLPEFMTTSGFFPRNSYLMPKNLLDSTLSTMLSNEFAQIIRDAHNKDDSNLKLLYSICPDMPAILNHAYTVFMNNMLYPDNMTFDGILKKIITYHELRREIVNVITPIFMEYWENILCAQYFTDKLYKALQSTANNPDIMSKISEFITTYILKPDHIIKLHHEEINQICQEIKSLDKDLININPNLFTQYVLSTSCFRSVGELKHIYTHLELNHKDAVDIKILHDLVLYLTDILCHDNNDICHIIVLQTITDTTTYYMPCPIEKPNLHLMQRSLTSWSNTNANENLKYISFNYWRNTSTAQRIFSGFNENITTKTYPASIFCVETDSAGQVQYPSLSATEKTLNTIQAAPKYVIQYIAKALNKYNKLVIADLIAQSLSQTLQFYTAHIKLSDTDSIMIQRCIHTLCMNLGRSVYVEREVKKKLFQDFNDKWFSGEYASLLIRYLTYLSTDSTTMRNNIDQLDKLSDAAKQKETSLIINEIRDTICSSDLATIQLSVTKLIQEIITVMPHLGNKSTIPNLVEQIKMRCNLSTIYKNFHINLVIAVPYLYLSSTFALGISDARANIAFSFFRLNGLYYIATCLQELLTTPSNNLSNDVKDQILPIAQNIMREIFQILNEECSAIIASRLSSGESSPILSGIIDVVKQMMNSVVEEVPAIDT